MNSSWLMQWYNRFTGKQRLSPVRRDDVYPTPGTVVPEPAWIASKMIRANEVRRNREQNIGRASVIITSDSLSFPANTFIVPPFDYYDSIPSRLRSWQSAYCNALGINGEEPAFVCEQSGWYSIEGAIDVYLSQATVLACKPSSAEATLIITPRGYPNNTLFWQHTAYGGVHYTVGPPETVTPQYMQGWCHTINDKVYMACGDMLWVAHKYSGVGDVAFVERYEARLAIQRTGDPPITKECC